MNNYAQNWVRLGSLAWIPMQKKKPNKSPDFLPYLRYNCLSTRSFLGLSIYRVPRC